LAPPLYSPLVQKPHVANRHQHLQLKQKAYLLALLTLTEPEALVEVMKRVRDMKNKA
jgi:hypothetical protein